jgi:hypothetical protein
MATKKTQKTATGPFGDALGTSRRQKSTASNAQAVRFTINVTAVSKRAWIEARSEHSYLSERPSASISYGPLAWQRRIGQLLSDSRDKSWTVAARASTESLRVDVVEAIRIYALPAIEQELAHGPGEGYGTLGRHI